MHQIYNNVTCNNEIASPRIDEIKIVEIKDTLAKQ